VADFLRAIGGRERPEHDLSLARDVVRLAEAAQTSLANGGERVPLAGETSISQVA
jgi:predicted dehydrogenase